MSGTGIGETRVMDNWSASGNLALPMYLKDTPCDAGAAGDSPECKLFIDGFDELVRRMLWESTDPTAFLNGVYTRVLPHGPHGPVLRFVIGEIDQRLRRGDIMWGNRVLQSVAPERCTVRVLLAILSATRPWRARLGAREAFKGVVRARALADGKSQADVDQMLADQ